ncbi:proteinase B [Sorochytrium milnesiophthora]
MNPKYDLNALWQQAEEVGRRFRLQEPASYALSGVEEFFANHLIQAQNVEGKGRGVVAVAPIASGTLLAACKPCALAFPPYNALPNVLAAAILSQALAEPQMQRLRRMTGAGAMSSLQDCANVVKFNGFDIDNWWLPAAVKARVVDGMLPQGLWIESAQLNHACVGNVRRAIIGDVMFLMAAGDIEPGQELVWTYVDPGAPYPRRASSLREQYGFECDCRLCVQEKALDPRIWQRWDELERRFLHIDNEDASSTMLAQLEACLQDMRQLLQPLRFTSSLLRRYRRHYLQHLWIWDAVRGVIPDAMFDHILLQPEAELAATEQAALIPDVVEIALYHAMRRNRVSFTQWWTRAARWHTECYGGGEDFFYSRATARPVYDYSKHTGQVIPGHYVVVMDDSVTDAHFADHQNWLFTTLATQQVGGELQRANSLKHIYDMHGLKGYAGIFESNVVEMLMASPQARLAKPSHFVITKVAFVEPDQMMYANNLQTNAPWGLSRISHRKKPTPAHYKEYPYPDHVGHNVSVYVIDTGINIHHKDFEGRASWGATIPDNDEDIDGNGHGTHCAGTIAGKTYGVAKDAHVIAVKVLSSNGSGTMSDVLKGVEWAASDHKKRVAKNKKARSAANMSLGGGRSRALDRAVDAAVKMGIHFAVAAGNDNRNACNYSPAASELAITVGATANDDKMAWFSNHGKCVDVFGPGKDITSTWIGSNDAINTISGTSMASPHVAGLLAFYLSEDIDHDYTYKELKELVIKRSTRDVIKGLPKPGGKGPKLPLPFPWPPGNGDGDDEDEGKTPNRLIFTDFEDGGKEPDDGKKPGDGDDDDDDGGHDGDDDGDDDDNEGLSGLLKWISRGWKHVKFTFHLTRHHHGH